MFVAPADRQEEEGDGDQAGKHHVTSALHAVLFCMGGRVSDTCWTLVRRWMGDVRHSFTLRLFAFSGLTEKAVWVRRLNYR